MESEPIKHTLYHFFLYNPELEILVGSIVGGWQEQERTGRVIDAWDSQRRAGWRMMGWGDGDVVEEAGSGVQRTPADG